MKSYTDTDEAHIHWNLIKSKIENLILNDNDLKHSIEIVDKVLSNKIPNDDDVKTINQISNITTKDFVEIMNEIDNDIKLYDIDIDNKSFLKHKNNINRMNFISAPVS